MAALLDARRQGLDAARAARITLDLERIGGLSQDAATNAHWCRRANHGKLMFLFCSHAFALDRDAVPLPCEPHITYDPTSENPSAGARYHRLRDRRRRVSVRDILAAVTPGGGKSLLPVIAAARLIAAGVVDRVCWIVPRESLRLQAEEAFADPAWRGAIGHAVTVRGADNGPDLCRGLQGYVTTYQAIAAAPDLHLAEIRRHRYLIVVDELHHLPALSDLDPFTSPGGGNRLEPGGRPHAGERRLPPAHVGNAAARRRPGDPAAALPPPARFPAGPGDRLRGAGLGGGRLQPPPGLGRARDHPGDLRRGRWRGRMDRRRWADAARRLSGRRPHAGARRPVHGAAHRVRRSHAAHGLHRLPPISGGAPARPGLGPEDSALGLGKLLVVAPDQASAWRYAAKLQDWAGMRDIVRVAVSSAPDPHGTIAEFRLRPDPAVLVTVGMAYEGMDCPEITHVACLTHIRSRGWLEQMVARATRFDPLGGCYERQRAVVYHPDDPMFRSFRTAIETEQGVRADLPADLPLDGEEVAEEVGDGTRNGEADG